MFPILATGALLLAIAGCGDEPSYFEISHVEGNGTPPSISPEQAAAGASTVTHLMGYLNPTIRSNSGRIVAWSPLALTSTLAQLRAGSRGSVATGLDEAFGTDGGTEAFARSIHAADETARRLDGPTGGPGGELRRVDVGRGDALWGRSGATWSPGFLDTLTGSYGSSMWMANLERDPDRARAEIDRWVGERTGGQIDRILPKAGGRESDRLVVTSALSFSAPWETPMLTLPDAPFTVPSAPVPEVDVVTVGVEAPLAVREGAGWKAVTIPYAGRNSAMTVIIPAEGEDIEIAAPAVLAEAVPQLTTPVEPSLVALSMPAFAIDTPLGGIQNLRGTSLFEPGVDLFPMSDDPEGRPLRVDSLHQRTFVRVDAAGTSLTESTIEARDTDAMPLADAEPFVVAGPFAFVIHDTATGIPLIVGWVGDAPTPS